MATKDSELAPKKLLAKDLRECASHYRWAKRPISTLMAGFPDDRPLDAAGLARIDAWVPRDPTEDQQGGPKPAFDQLAERPIGPRILEAVGLGPLGRLRERLRTGSPRTFVSNLVRASALRPNVPEELAFPLTVLLRCLVPTRFPILTKPLEVAEIMVPSELRRRGIRDRRQSPRGPRGLGWPWAWLTHEDFVADYLAYATWHRSLALQVGIDQPGELDDGCWQLSRCLERRTCPGKGSGRAFCSTGMMVMANEGLRTELGVPGSRYEIFYRILESFGDEPLSKTAWDDVASMLMPEADVVRRLFARSREATAPRKRKEPGSRRLRQERTSMLRGLERAFGEYLIRVLVTGDPSLADHPYELGKRFAMHGTAIQRYLNSVRKRPS